MFNQPLGNSLAGTIDPVTGKDACPISLISRIGAGDPTQAGITAPPIVTCPNSKTAACSCPPLAGQAVGGEFMAGTVWRGSHPGRGSNCTR